MAPAHSFKSSDHLRDRARRGPARGGSAAAHRRGVRQARRRSRADRFLRRDVRVIRIPFALTLGCRRPGALRRPAATWRPRPWHAPVPRFNASPRTRSAVLEARLPRRRHLPRRARACAQPRPGHGTQRPCQPPDHVPASTRSAPDSCSPRGASAATTAPTPRTWRTRRAPRSMTPRSSSTDRGRTHGEAQSTTMLPPLLSRTATTCQRVGPATHTCSPPCSSAVLHRGLAGRGGFEPPGGT